MTETTERRIFAHDLEDFCIAGLLASGLRDRDARVTAEVLVTTDTWGIYTHGTKSLRQYMRRLRTSGLDPAATPEVVAEGPAWAIVDGHTAIAMVTSCAALEIAISKAQVAGIGYVGVRNSGHFGAAGYYANLAARAGLIGLAMSNVDPNMTVPGGRGKIIGNNPFAYAVPAGAERPVFLDIAMSTVAAGKVMAARFLDQRIPDTWLVGDDGLPTTDPNRYPEAGSLSPMAAHKGYGLALLVEILAGVIAGGGILHEVTSWIMNPAPSQTCHAFIAIDVGAIMPVQQFQDRMDQMIRQIRTLPRAAGSERIYLPGEIEWERRAGALERGIPLPDDVIDSLLGASDDLGIAKPAFFTA